ncbi:unnamed protein product [Calypogeia fissa]
MASSVCSLSIAAPVRSLGAVSGELAGAGAQSLRHCSSSSTSSSSSSAAATPLLVQPIAKRVCDLTGKKANNGYRVSFSKHRTKHLQGVNLQYKRLWWEEANKFVRLRISTRALKTIEKKGLSVMAKEAGIDLNDYAV